jgi:hypothetical protein
MWLSFATGNVMKKEELFDRGRLPVGLCCDTQGGNGDDGELRQEHVVVRNGYDNAGHV